MIHELNRRLYAQDGEETPRPWERWQVYWEAGETWLDLTIKPYWLETERYRRKPRIVRIGDHEATPPTHTERSPSFTKPCIVTLTFDNEPVADRFLQILEAATRRLK